MSRFAIEQTPIHQCETCKYTHKCTMFSNIVTQLKTIEVMAFDRWGIDLNIYFNIEDCYKYKIDWIKTQEQLLDEYYFEDREDGEDYE